MVNTVVSHNDLDKLWDIYIQLPTHFTSLIISASFKWLGISPIDIFSKSFNAASIAKHAEFDFGLGIVL